MMMMMKACLALLLAMGSASASPLWSVLTDNATGEEPVLRTGVTYTATPPFTNPADTTGRRLIDAGGAWNDWTNTVGINDTDQTLLFDLKRPYHIGKVALQLDMPAKPAYVAIALGEQPDGPWTEAGRITPGERSGWYEATLPGGRPARYVRLFFKLGEWGWYMREVKIWGTRGDEPGPEVVLPSERRGRSLLLARDGEPRASIIVAAQPTAKALAAARDLQDHLYRMSGAVLPVRTDERDWTGTLLLVGPSRFLAEMGVTVPTGYPENEQVILRTKGTRVALVGNDEGTFTGTEFAVQMLLEKLGCGWFGPTPLWQPVPRRPTVVLPPLNVAHTPPFALRHVWIGQGKRWYLGGPPLNSNHAHETLFPPKEYFAEHPEYYALIGGKRTAEGEWQLCTANQEVIRLTIEKARAFFDQHPTQVMFSLSNNDCGGFCECEACLRSGSNPGARMLAFANAVARGLRATHPDKWVLFLAYWYTDAAPKEAMKAEPGVAVMVVGSQCHAHPLTDLKCARNVAWRENFARWVQTGARMAIYEWYIPGCSLKPWRRLPWVAGETATRDLDLWRAAGVRWITYESQTAYEEKPYPLRWPLFYVAARRMWDPNASADALLGDACRKLFGPAAGPMRRFYGELARALRRCPQHGGNWNLPDANAVYPPAVVARARQYLEQAEAAAATAQLAVRQRIGEEAEAWALAEQTLSALRAAKQPPRLRLNDREFAVEQAVITGKYVRDLGGIAQEEKILLITPAGEREVGDAEELQVVEGMEFRSVPR